MNPMDFAQALTQFMTKAGLNDAQLGADLLPQVKAGAVRKWRFGESEPRRIHRRQLIAMSGGIITPKHFV